MDDNGTRRSFSAGDISMTRSGEYHGLKNTGEGHMLVYALVIRD